MTISLGAAKIDFRITGKETRGPFVFLGTHIFRGVFGRSAKKRPSEIKTTRERTMHFKST